MKMLRGLFAKDYWQMSDHELNETAKQHNITGPGGWFEREYIINQLVSRDNAIFNRNLSVLAFLGSVVAIVVSIIALFIR